MIADSVPWKTGNVALTLSLFEDGITAPSEFAKVDECRVGTVEFGLAGHIEQSFQWFSHFIFIPFSMFGKSWWPVLLKFGERIYFRKSLSKGIVSWYRIRLAEDPGWFVD